MDRLNSQDPQVYDLISLPVWIFSTETLKILYSNIAAQEWLGYNAATLLSKRITDIRPESERAPIVSQIRQFVASSGAETNAGTWTIMSHSGRAHIANFSWKKVLYKGEKSIVATIEDKTSLKETERELAEASRRQSLAVRLAKLGSWRIDLDPFQVTWDETTQEILGLSSKKSATFEELLKHFKSELRSRLKAVFDVCIQEGRQIDEVLELTPVDGQTVCVRTLGEPVRNTRGEIVAVEGAFQDISDVIEARDATARLSRRLHQTLESISDAFFLLTRDWRFAFVNTQAELLLGKPREELLGEVAFDVFPEAWDSPFHRNYERAFEENVPVRFQAFYPPLDTWFEASAFPTPEGLAVYFRDITQKRAREENLRLLENAVSRQRDILLITEAEAAEVGGWPRIVYVNAALENQLGYAPQETIGDTPAFLTGPNTDQKELERVLAALENHQPVYAQMVNYDHSGKERWLEWDIVPLADSDGQITHHVAVVRDVTKKKKTQEALERSQQRFQIVSKATKRVVWERDVKQGRIWWSSTLKDVFGHELQTEGDGLDVWKAHVHPEDAERIEAAVGSLLEGRRDAYKEQYRFRRADGSWAVVEDQAAIVVDGGGATLSLVGSLTDISEGVLLEDQLRRAQKMEAVGQLTGGIAHDFNNLLTVILGSSDALADELAGHASLQKQASMIVHAAERGAELTDRLLSFARKQALRPEVLNIGKLLSTAKALLVRTLPEDIELEIKSDEHLWYAEVDPGQLEAALLNLALNARDALPDGGRLQLEASNVCLSEEDLAETPECEPGPYVAVTVIDNGKGMPPDVARRVFEPFFTTKGVGEGSGLGLSMVYGFVKQSGGHISVESAPDKGTVFRLYFPRVRSEIQMGRVQALSRKHIGGNETILLVEDDPLVRAHLTSQLEGLGYHILSAASGKEALELVQSAPPIDLLFSDVVMPGMNGQELAEQLLHARPDTKVLFTSGYSENTIVQGGKLVAGVELLGKPYKIEALATKIRKVLDA